uniref:Uncharacterized protein n=1 Tax=Strombidium inclinatum TaxID=197538 RepID=A0A7S3IHG0_9SPIT
MATISFEVSLNSFLFEGKATLDDHWLLHELVRDTAHQVVREVYKLGILGRSAAGASSTHDASVRILPGELGILLSEVALDFGYDFLGDRQLVFKVDGGLSWGGGRLFQDNRALGCG